MSELREFPEITTKEFDERLLSKMEDMTVIDIIQLSGIYKIMSEYYEVDILAEYKEDNKPKTDYKTELEIFKNGILPSVTVMFGLDDRVAICEAWSNWADALCKDGRITEYQRDNWNTPF